MGGVSSSFRSSDSGSESDVVASSLDISSSSMSLVREFTRDLRVKFRKAILFMGIVHN